MRSVGCRPRASWRMRSCICASDSRRKRRSGPGRSRLIWNSVGSSGVRVSRSPGGGTRGWYAVVWIGIGVPGTRGGGIPGTGNAGSGRTGDGDDPTGSTGGGAGSTQGVGAGGSVGAGQGDAGRPDAVLESPAGGIPGGGGSGRGAWAYVLPKKPLRSQAPSASTLPAVRRGVLRPRAVV